MGALSEIWTTDPDRIQYVTQLSCQIMQLLIILPCLGLSRTSEDKEEEKCKWYRRNMQQYMATFQRTEIHHALLVTKGVDFKSGEKST